MNTAGMNVDAGASGRPLLTASVAGRSALLPSARAFRAYAPCALPLPPLHAFRRGDGRGLAVRMKRSDVRAWLHQAALDVARLAEPRRAHLPERGPSVTCAGHESFFDAEREARALAWLAGVTYVVVEVREQNDPSGVEALFVVCTDESVDQVPGRREVAFRTELAALRSEAAERAPRGALLLSNRALQILDQGCDQAMHDVLWELQRSLRAAQRFPTAPDHAASASPRPVEGGPPALESVDVTGACAGEAQPKAAVLRTANLGGRP